MQHTTRIATAVIFSGLALFTSCKKETSNTDQLASLGKTTITGKVFAPMVDTIGAADVQYAPSGTTIQAWIDTRDLTVVAASTTYAKRYYTATVDGSGNYTLSVDVNKNQAVTVHIESPNFAHDVVKKMYPDSVYNQREVFYQNAVSPVSATSGSTQIADVNFMYH